MRLIVVEHCRKELRGDFMKGRDLVTVNTDIVKSRMIVVRDRP